MGPPVSYSWGQANLNRYTQHLQSWFRTTDAAQLTLLACHVAAGDAGMEFVKELADLTGTVVTASATEVGNGQWPPVATQTFRQTVLDTYAATLVLTFKQAIKDGSLDGDNPNTNRLF